MAAAAAAAVRVEGEQIEAEAETVGPRLVTELEVTIYEC